MEKSTLGDGRNNYPQQVARINPIIRDGIIEKWLGYCKSDNLTKFMVWRLQLMKQNFTGFEVRKMKKIMGRIKIIDEVLVLKYFMF